MATSHDTDVLALDVENTYTTLGLFRKGALVRVWRTTTGADRTSDDWGFWIQSLAASVGLHLQNLQGVVLSSVVPAAKSAVQEMCLQYLHIQPLVIGPGVRTGLVLKYDNPRDVGADRIANAVAALHETSAPVMIVDIRTAITLSVLNREGHYVGGVIAPGLQSSADALFQKAARLPKVDLVCPEQVIGRNTQNSMQSGILRGFAGLVDRLIGDIQEEAGLPFQVIATGWQMPLLVPLSHKIQNVYPNLTLTGLYLLWKLNQ